MTRFQALKNEALELTDSDRAALATELLHSLPAALSDEDEGVSEALRPDSEISENPSMGITWDVLKKGLGRD